MIMINMKYLELICRSKTELPSKVIERYLPLVMERLDGSFITMFPELAIAMPLTYGAVIQNYRPPVIGTETTIQGKAIATMILEGEKTNLVSNPHLNLQYEFQSLDEQVYWLPKRLRAWYAATDGLQRLPNADPVTPPLSCYDLPVPVSGRETAASYCSMHGYKKIAAKPLHQALGCKQATAWLMLKEGTQAIFANEEYTGGSLYHVFGDDFKNFYELPDPENTIDAYCAHVIAGGEPEQFDFRA